MSAKYRIVSTTKSFGNGKVDVSYEIQKKFLFLWIGVFFKHHYHTYPPCWALIERTRFLFSTYRRAEEIILLLKQPSVIKYKGYLIRRVFKRDQFKEVDVEFITNFKREYIYGIGMGYHSASTIVRLQAFIDEKVFTAKRNISSYINTHENKIPQKP